MANILYPWHEDNWRALQQLRSRLPHAILFYGPHGIGKTDFAESFAQALLCEAPQADGRACGACVSCGWFAQYSHPDYRRVRPEILDEEAATDDEDGEPAETSKPKGKGKPSKEIRIDQVRALADFLNISTHRQGQRVILLHPAEALNRESSNALLKALEEPPPNTVFLLVTSNPGRLLPTILSRCRKFSLAMPAQPEALAWLRKEGVQDAEMWLAEQGGAPLSALALAQTGSRAALDELLAHLAKPGVDAALKAAERLQKEPVVDLVSWMQRWLYDLFSVKLSGRIRYYPGYQKQLSALAARAETGDLLRALKAANERRAVAEHPLSARLFIEDMLLDYSRVFS